MKKILIYSLSTGSGHNRIASYIKEYYERNGDQVKILDFFKDNQKRLLNFFINDCYTKVIKYFLPIYNHVYARLSREVYDQRGVSRYPLLFKILLINMQKSIVSNLTQFEPDIVICTHVFASLVLSKMKKDYDLDFKLYGFVTDINIHPFWQYISNVDKLFILNHSNSKIVANKGFDTQVINLYQLYSKPQNKADFVLKNKNKNLKILLMPRNANFREVKKQFESLKKIKTPTSVTILCGGDFKMKKYADKVFGNFKSKKVNIKILFTTKRVQTMQLYKDADIVVSKIGINTMYEALKNACILVPFNVVSENEKQNKKILRYYNLCPIFTSKRSLSDYVNNQKFSSENLQSYRENIYDFLLNNGDRCSDLVLGD